MVQQEHIINELENSKKILEAEISLSKKVVGDTSLFGLGGDPIQVGASRAGLNVGFFEMKLSLLGHRIQLVESENLRLRQDALRAEQLRLSEMQINLERRHSQLSNSYVMDSGGCVNQGDSVLPTRVKSRWTNIENVYTPRPFFPGPASVHMNQCDPNIPTREQSRWTSDRNGYTPRPHFPRPVSVHVNQVDTSGQNRLPGINQRPYFPKSAPVHSYGPQVSQSQKGSALLASVSSPHVVVPVSPSPSSKVTQANNYTRPSIARMSVKDSAGVVSNTNDPTDISISQETADKDDCIILPTQGNPKSTDCVIVSSSSPVRPNAVEDSHQMVQPQEGIVGTSEPLETAQQTEQEPKLMQGRDTVPISDDRVMNGVQQSFLGQATVPAKPPWQVPVIPVSPATMQRGNHMLMNQSPVVTPMTHRYLYPQLQYPVVMVPQHSILRTSTPTSYIFPH